MGLERWLVVGLGAVCLAVAPGAVREAEACYPWRPDNSRGVLPYDGMSGVPLNARVVVDWTLDAQVAHTAEQLDPVLRLVGGAEVAVTIERLADWPRDFVVARPQVILEPQTSYEVLLRPVLDGDHLGDTPEVVATFTTGDAIDTAAPVFGGLQEVTYSPDVCEGNCTCDFDWWRVVGYFKWSSASGEDLPGGVRYSVYRTGTDEPVALWLHDLSASATHLCRGNDLEASYVDFTAGDGVYYVRAIDVAGNEDGNQATVDVRFDCGLVDEDEGGCGCSGAGGPAANGRGWLLVTLLVVPVGRWVRRRRARGGPPPAAI